MTTEVTCFTCNLCNPTTTEGTIKLIHRIRMLNVHQCIASTRLSTSILSSHYYIQILVHGCIYCINSKVDRHDACWYISENQFIYKYKYIYNLSWIRFWESKNLAQKSWELSFVLFCRLVALLLLTMPST